MYALGCCNRNRSVFNIQNSIISQLISRFNFYQKINNTTTESHISLSTYSSSSPHQANLPNSFVVSYLINTYGLSPQSAISISNKVHFTNPDKPDAVLAFLIDQGFDKSHLPRLLRIYPDLIVCDVDKLRQKFNYLSNTFGLSGTQLANSTSLTPRFFQYSLVNRIIPCCDFLKKCLFDDRKVIAALMNGSSLLRCDVHQHLAPNVELLRRIGVPSRVISYALTCYPNLLTRNQVRFSGAVDEVIKMGFDPSLFSFMVAIHATISISKSTWERKVNVYKSWSWSDDDILLAFRKCPFFMLHSEKKISSLIGFLVKDMGFLPSSISRNPGLLNYSVKRVVPRSTILRIIQLKGLMEGKFDLYSALKAPEKIFLDKFVTPFSEQVPQLLSVYQGKISYLDLGFRPEDMSGC